MKLITDSENRRLKHATIGETNEKQFTCNLHKNMDNGMLIKVAIVFHLLFCFNWLPLGTLGKMEEKGKTSKEVRRKRLFLTDGQCIINIYSAVQVWSFQTFLLFPTCHLAYSLRFSKANMGQQMWVHWHIQNDLLNRNFNCKIMKIVTHVWWKLYQDTSRCQ